MARLGEIIDGKYEILREIGKGGMSVVYLAMDKRLNKQWAIKEFRKDKDDASKQVALKALLDEANLMKKLDHPTLPRIVDIIEGNQTVYIVMDYIEGESLNKVLDAYGAQPQEAVIEWAKQLSAVLDYLHTQSPPVIYRDMKPANIMLKPDGTVRLIDFGIAREYKEGKEGDTEAIGTRGYAAPEQFGGRGQTDARTDIYSLGVTLYHLVTGKNPAEPPYEIYPIRHWDPTLSSGLEWLIQKCTQLNPNDRYQSCAEVTYVLENLDKFETEYKKKQKSRIHQFVASAVMTVVMGIGCAACLISASEMKKSTYESYLSQSTVSGYQKAIELDQDNPEAYVKAVEKLRAVCQTLLPGDNPNGDEVAIKDVIYDQDILKLFASGNLENLKKDYPQEYIKIHYELGYLYWDKYKDKIDGKEQLYKEGASNAVNHFEKVILLVDDLGLEKSGLSEKKYNLAKAYYLVSYFSDNKEKLDGQDDGDFEPELAVKLAGATGIDDSGKMNNPYYTWWEVNEKLLEMIQNDNVTDRVRINTILRLANIVSVNAKDFKTKSQNKENKIDKARAEKFCKNMLEIVNHISASDVEDYTSKKAQIESSKKAIEDVFSDSGLNGKGSNNGK